VSLGKKSDTPTPIERGKLLPEANSGVVPLQGDYERMARRRYQNPKPKRRGNWWELRVWRDEFSDGERTRRRAYIKLAPATMSEREVKKIAAEYLRPMNQGLESLGSATNFSKYVEDTYKPIVLPLMASSTRSRSAGVIKNYLEPTFGRLSLRDLSPLVIQRYFSGMAASNLSGESKDKIRDVLASILGSAVKYGLLVKNPCEAVQLPPEKRGKRKAKPFIYRHQFDAILSLIAEPYASMVFAAVFTGFRVSELAALKWGDVDSINNKITIDERYCRGDWGEPKSDASNATVPVNREVIERILKLKDMTVNVNWGGNGAKKMVKVVRSSGTDDLVFQGLRFGRPMRDNNILSRHIKPAARKLGLGYVNWQVLRRSFGTWLKITGADPKDAQGLMRHSRISTTMDIYVQDVPESQRRAVDRLSKMVN
jgi:integrase